MKHLTATSPESHSLDLIAGNIAKLKAIFPELLTEGKDGAAVNVDVLKQLVGDATLTDADEKYGLTWNGKRKARLEALKPSTGTLRPAKADSVSWDTTQNVVIEGDNLEVLKLLQKSYANSVKLIYIDPPYNTGKDFVYPDDYQDNLRNYQERMGTLGVEQNAETSGRFHTDWLNMMYCRIALCRNLLMNDGTLYVSIDDSEVANLRKVLDEVFGAENFVANIIWEKKFSPQNDAKWLSDTHDHILLYAKNKADWRPIRMARTDATNSRYTNPDNDPRGAWMSSDMTVRTYSEAYDYPIQTPSGKVIKPTKGRCWSMPKDKVQELIADNRIWFGKDGSNVPRFKSFLSDMTEGMVPMTIWKHKDVGHNQEARQELKNLDLGVFDSPKPVRLIRNVTNLSTSGDDIILDFFAGSGTTGHAVMAQNAADGGNRRYILVQLPEPLNPEKKEQKVAAAFCDKLGKPRTIAELTKERLRRAAQKVKAENPLFHGDLGFRVFKLDTSNLKAWDPHTANVPQSLLDAAEHVKPGRTADDLLYELLLKKGLDLAVPMQSSTIAGKEVVAIGGGVMLVCLAEAIAVADAEPLALGIAAWHQQLAPANPKESVVVFRDSAFEGNVAKSNLAEILKQRGLEKVNSI